MKIQNFAPPILKTYTLPTTPIPEVKNKMKDIFNNNYTSQQKIENMN
jgi:hypothetical protein